MIRREVVFAPEARDDLLALYDWIAGAADPEKGTLLPLGGGECVVPT